MLDALRVMHSLKISINDYKVGIIVRISSRLIKHNTGFKITKKKVDVCGLNSCILDNCTLTIYEHRGHVFEKCNNLE